MEHSVVGYDDGRVKDIFVVDYIINSYLDKEKLAKKANEILRKFCELEDDVSSAMCVVQEFYKKATNVNSVYILGISMGKLASIYRICYMSRYNLKKCLDNIDVITIQTFKSTYLYLYDQFADTLEEEGMSDYDCNGFAYKRVFRGNNLPQTELLKKFCDGTYQSGCIKIWDGDLI